MTDIILPGDSPESQAKKVLASKGVDPRDIPVPADEMVRRLTAAVRAMKVQSDKMAVILTAFVISHGLRGKLGISKEALAVAAKFDGRIAMKKDEGGIMIQIVATKSDDELSKERENTQNELST